MLEEALAAGVAAGGGDAMLGGVLPTRRVRPDRRLGFDLAAVVSASHNPFADNGIKFLGPRGTKLDDDAETAIEELLDEKAGDRVGGVRTLEGALTTMSASFAPRSPSTCPERVWRSTARTAPPTGPLPRSSARSAPSSSSSPWSPTVEHQRELRLDSPRWPDRPRSLVGRRHRIRV